MIHRRLSLIQIGYALFTLLALCAITATGCGFQPSNKTPKLIPPSPTPEWFSAAHREWETPSIEMRVLKSDVIVRVRPPSVTGEVNTIPSADEGVAPTYQPVLVFQFPVIEYLKGNGGDTLSVEFSFAGEWPAWGDHTFMTREDAQRVLTNQLAERNTTWENRDAVLFLSMDTQQIAAGAAGAAASYQFTSYGPIEYTLDEISKPWLPVAGSEAGASGQSGGDPAYLLDSEPPEGSTQLPTMSLAELRASVESIAAVLKAGEGIEGYKECVEYRLISENPNDKTSRSRVVAEDTISSGSPQRTLLPRTEGIWDSGLGYGSWHMAGPDADYFQIHITDSPTAEEGYDIDYDDNSAEEVIYYRVYTTTRPLPGGTYRFVVHSQWAQWKPCNYTIPINNWPQWEVTATAPDGVLHEAFFDPAPLGVGVGANSASDGIGALKPAEFKHNGVSVAIEQIEWSPNTNKVALKLSNRSVKLAGHHIDFIELDASVSLRLDIDDAETTSTGYGQTLSWEVCRQPWHPGDQLMLRIAKSATAASATIKPVCADDGKPAATATPTPKTTPTHTPTVTADTTATPTYTPTASPTPPQPTATVVPTATPTNTPATAPTTTPTPAPTLTPTPPAGGVSGAIDTPTPTPTSTPTATATHTPTIAPTATLESSSDVVTGQ